jgi:hypothetical protein
MGFPDVSWENYFAPPPEAPTDFEALVRELLVSLNGKK